MYYLVVGLSFPSADWVTSLPSSGCLSRLSRTLPAVQEPLDLMMAPPEASPPPPAPLYCGSLMSLE